MKKLNLALIGGIGAIFGNENEYFYYQNENQIDVNYDEQWAYNDGVYGYDFYPLGSKEYKDNLKNLNIGKLTLYRGASGSGKTTLAKRMVEHNVADVYFEADMFFMKNGKYEFDFSKIKEAHLWCQQQTLKALLGGKNVVVSNTFTKLWEIKPYLEMVDSDNLKVRKLRTLYQNIHNVSDEVLERMIQNYEPYQDEKIIPDEEKLRKIKAKYEADKLNTTIEYSYSDTNPCPIKI